LKCTVRKFAKECGCLFAVTRLFKNFAIFRYNSIARDHDGIFNSTYHSPSFRLGEFSCQRGRVGIPNGLFVDGAGMHLVFESKNVQRPFTRLRFGCKNNFHGLTSCAAGASGKPARDAVSIL